MVFLPPDIRVLIVSFTVRDSYVDQLIYFCNAHEYEKTVFMRDMLEEFKEEEHDECVGMTAQEFKLYFRLLLEQTYGPLDFATYCLRINNLKRSR